MHLHEAGHYVVIHTPAKLNLFLEILDRRSDGFHEVETVVYPVDLCDTLIVRKRVDEGIRFRVSCVGQGVLGSVPADSSNLVVRAMESLRRIGGYHRGADVQLIKRIPSEAGLGGGSSDAAAALIAANRAWELNLPPPRLAEIGANLGSDIPLFFQAGPSVCRGRGEIVEAVGAAPMLCFVVVRPPSGLSTAEVYGATEVARVPRPLPDFLEAFNSAQLGPIGDSLFNRLEVAAGGLTPWIGRIRSAFEALDCAGHSMTGSGTGYFGLCRHIRHARRVARRLESYGLGKAYAVRGCR